MYSNIVSVQLAGKSSGRAITRSRQEARRISTPVNGLAKRYGASGVEAENFLLIPFYY